MTTKKWREVELLARPPYIGWGRMRRKVPPIGAYRTALLAQGVVIDTQTQRQFFSPSTWVYALRQGEI